MYATSPHMFSGPAEAAFGRVCSVVSPDGGLSQAIDPMLRDAARMTEHVEKAWKLIVELSRVGCSENMVPHV